MQSAPKIYKLDFCRRSSDDEAPTITVVSDSSEEIAQHPDAELLGFEYAGFEVRTGVREEFVTAPVQKVEPKQKEEEDQPSLSEDSSSEEFVTAPVQKVGQKQKEEEESSSEEEIAQPTITKKLHDDSFRNFSDVRLSKLRLEYPGIEFELTSETIESYGSYKRIYSMNFTGQEDHVNAMFPYLKQDVRYLINYDSSPDIHTLCWNARNGLVAAHAQVLQTWEAMAVSRSNDALNIRSAGLWVHGGTEESRLFLERIFLKGFYSKCGVILRERSLPSGYGFQKGFWTSEQIKELTSFYMKGPLVEDPACGSDRSQFSCYESDFEKMLTKLKTKGGVRFVFFSGSAPSVALQAMPCFTEMMGVIDLRDDYEDTDKPMVPFFHHPEFGNIMKGFPEAPQQT